MKLPFSLFLALKYLRPKRTFLSVVTVLSVLGVLLGVAVLIVVLSVMSGFDEMWREKILAFNAHITVVGDGPGRGGRGVVRAHRSPCPACRVPRRSCRASSSSGREGAFMTPVLRGVDPDREAHGEPGARAHASRAFSPCGTTSVVIGSDLAARLDARVGDRLLVYSPQGFLSSDEMRLPEEMTVAGIFELGMYDFDVGYALCSLGTRPGPVRRRATGCTGVR